MDSKTMKLKEFLKSAINHDNWNFKHPAITVLKKTLSKDKKTVLADFEFKEGKEKVVFRGLIQRNKFDNDNLSFYLLFKESIESCIYHYTITDTITEISCDNGYCQAPVEALL